MAVQDLARIEDKIDRVAAGGTAISMGFGGVKFQTMMELMEFSKLMAVSGAAVPIHLRGNPGACLAICTKAMRFNFDPYALAEHSFLMKKPTKIGDRWEDVETIAYDSFVIHAIIEAHAPIEGRLRPKYSGEGDDLKVMVIGTPKGEREPLTHTSQTVGEIIKQIGRNEKGKLKGSPLWETKPEQQLWYYARRDFCRKYFPEILLGWYDKDEFEEAVRAETAIDITPTPDIAKRLKGGKKKQGFDDKHVEQQIGGGDTKASHSGEKGAASDPAPHAAPEPTSATPAADPVPEPSEPLSRGTRLLANLKTPAEIKDLMDTISEELEGTERELWQSACEARLQGAMP